MANVSFTDPNIRPAIGAIKAPAPVTKKFSWLDAECTLLDAKQEGRHTELTTLNGQLQDVKAKRGWCVEHAESSGQKPDETELAEHDAEIARIQSALDSRKVTGRSDIASGSALRKVRNESFRLIKKLNGSIKVVEVSPPKGADLGTHLGKKGERQAQRQLIDEAVVPEELTWTRLESEIDSLGETGRPKLNLELASTGPHARARLRNQLSIRWPLESLRAEPLNGGELPVVSNAIAMVCWLAGDQIKTLLRAELKEIYAGVELALTPEDRDKRLRELDVEILQLDREIASLAWIAIWDGDSSAARHFAGLDPRAVLGVA